MDLGSTADATNLLTIAQQGRLVWNDLVLTASLQQVQPPQHRNAHNRQRPFPITNPGGRGPPDRGGRGGGGPPPRGGPHRDKMGRGRSDRNMRRERPY